MPASSTGESSTVAWGINVGIIQLEHPRLFGGLSTCWRYRLEHLHYLFEGVSTPNIISWSIRYCWRFINARIIS